MSFITGFSRVDRERDAARRARARQARQAPQPGGAPDLSGLGSRMADLDAERARRAQALREAEQARDEARQQVSASAREAARAALTSSLHMARNVLNGGEISPDMAARVDQPRYQTGGLRLENMMPLPQGGVTKRPGLRHVGETLRQGEGDAVRLLPFVFNVGETRVLELAAGAGAGGIETKPAVPEARLQINANGEAANGRLRVRCTVLGADAGKCAYALLRTRESPDWQPIPADRVTRERVSVAVVDIGPLVSSSEIDGIRIEADGLSAFFLFAGTPSATGVSVGGNWQLMDGKPGVDCTAAGADMRRLVAAHIRSSLGASAATSFDFRTDDQGRVHARFLLPLGETLEQLRTVELEFPEGEGGAGNVYRFFGDEFGNTGEDGSVKVDPAQGSALRVWRPTATGATILHTSVAGALPYGADDLRELSFAQSADVIFLAHRRYPPAKLSRHADNDWRFEVIDWLPGIVAPVITEAVTVGNIPKGEESRTNHTYVATAVSGETGEESLPSAPVTVENAAPLSQSYYIKITVAPVAGASEYRVYKKRGGVFGFIGRIAGSGGNLTEGN